VPALPSPPPHLSDHAQVEWGRVSEELYKIGLLSGIDHASLAAYCPAYGRWATAERAIAEIGRDTGDPRCLNGRAWQPKNDIVLGMMHAGTQPGCHCPTRGAVDSSQPASTAELADSAELSTRHINQKTEDHW